MVGFLYLETVLFRIQAVFYSDNLSKNELSPSIPEFDPTLLILAILIVRLQFKDNSKRKKNLDFIEI